MNNSLRLEQMVSEITKKGNVRATLQRRTSSNVFAEDKFIYSYGHHYILGTLIGSTWLVNTERYSTSTGRHLSYLRSALSKNGVTSDKIIYTPIDTNSLEPAAIIRNGIRLLETASMEVARQLEKTRKGSGNNLRLIRELQEIEQSQRRLVVLGEMRGGQ